MQNLPKFTAFDLILIWISIVSITWFIYSFFELRRLHKKMKHSKLTEEKRWREIEAKAQKDYQEILETANKKAEEIIQNSTRISFDISSSLRQTIDKALLDHKSSLDTTSLTLTNKYAGELEEINKHNLELLTNVYKDIEIDAKAKFESYQKVLQEQTFEAERQAKVRIEEEYVSLEKELAVARERKIAELNDKVESLVKAISKDVVGKSLDPTTVSSLIIDSLEKAKKEGAI